MKAIGPSTTQTRCASPCRMRTAWLAIAGLLAILTPNASAKADQIWSIVGVDDDDGQIEIRLFGKPFATFSYRDEKIPRPYFANIRLPSGVQVTRNHPPRPGDAQDHAQLHPGLWLAFGDVSGNDYWRLRAPVKHLGFVHSPVIENGRLEFAVENQYLDQESAGEVCRETCRYEFQAYDDGVLLLWSSTFQSDRADFYFGDQEEMGLGVRVATPIAVRSNQGGRILNSNGERNERHAWGKQADWCDYSGMIDGRFVGIMLMPHPANFRKCWYHARDYGFVAANPFGKRAFTKGQPSKIVVRQGEPFVLRFGVFLHWNESAGDFDPVVVHRRYLKVVEEEAGQ